MNAVIVLLSGVSWYLTIETTQAILIRKECNAGNQVLTESLGWLARGWALRMASRNGAQYPSLGPQRSRYLVGKGVCVCV